MRDASTPQTALDRYVKQARRVGRGVALSSGYTSPEDGEQDATLILLEHLSKYPNASWLTIRKYILGRLWRLASPRIREERRRERV